MAEDVNAEALDHALWLSAPVFRRRAVLHRELRQEAAAIGGERGVVFKARFPGAPYSPAYLREAAAELGITAIRSFTETGEDKALAHSYYSPETGVIEYDSDFPALIMAAQKDLGLSLFSPPWVESCLLLHELYHHDEHLRHGQTDLLLSRKYRKPVPPVYREIAAFAYVNFCMKGPPCQLLDLLWLYRNHPGPWAETIDRYLR
jgi:hypothetical protein